MYMYIYIYTYRERERERDRIRPILIFSRAPEGNGIGATGSKTPPHRMLEPLFFSAQYGSKNPGLVLRPICHYTVALRGVAYIWGRP